MVLVQQRFAHWSREEPDSASFHQFADLVRHAETATARIDNHDGAGSIGVQPGNFGDDVLSDILGIFDGVDISGGGCEGRCVGCGLGELLLGWRGGMRVRLGVSSGLIASNRSGIVHTGLSSKGFVETLWCTASVGISIYPGLHCCSTSLSTLSNASVQIVSVTGGIWLSKACETESGSDIVLKVVNVDGVLRVWCRSDWDV